MPITRESQSVEDQRSEQSAVRRTPLEQDDAYELQDHEFTLVAEEPAEAHGWPFDEHTAPWSTLPPLPAWATKARALLEPPTLPRPLNDETPTLVEEASRSFSATAMRALREELAQSLQDAAARQERIEQLERALASAVAARAELELKSSQASSELQVRVQGQSARIRELEDALRDVAARRDQLEVAAKREAAARAAEEAARIAGAKAVEEAVRVAAEKKREAEAERGAAAERALEAKAAPEAARVAAAPDELPIVASDSDTDLETTVEWITNAAPSVEVTIEIDSNEDSTELATIEMPGPETTMELGPETVLMDADGPDEIVEAQVLGVAPAESGTAPASPKPRRRSIPRDALQRIEGIGKRLEARMYAKGIRTFAQIAALRAADLPEFAKRVAVTPERIAREGWVRQARKLKTQTAKRAAKAASAKRAAKPATRRARKHA